MVDSPLDVMVAALGHHAIDVTPIEGGRSGTEKFRVATSDGPILFAKIATSKAGERQHELVRREARTIAQVGDDPQAASFVGFFEASDYTAVVSEWIEGTAGDVWRPDTALRAAEALAGMATRLTGRRIDGQVLAGESHRFRTFTDAAEPPRSRPLGEQRIEWMSQNAGLLAELEGFGRRAMDASDLLHCDVSVSNLMLRPDGRVVWIDWGHARLGHRAYDMASLAVRVRADGADSPQLDRLIATSVSDESPLVWASMLTLTIGMFIEASCGELEMPSDSLADQRARFSRAGIDLLREAIA